MRHSYLSEAALEDLNEIWFFVARDGITTADRLLDQLMKRCDRIAANPERGRSRDEIRPGLRSVPFKGFLIFYAITRQGAEIVRVIHGQRDIETLLAE